MKAENTTTGHTRFIRITDIPGDMPELIISVSYHKFSNEGNAVAKAVVLDNLVIPEIIRSINNCGEINSLFNGIKAEMKAEQDTV
jgi:hypothetical protein